jgi:hypothetical protein
MHIGHSGATRLLAVAASALLSACGKPLETASTEKLFAGSAGDGRARGADLDDTERSVNQVPTPLAYAENLYFFREHVDVARRRIIRRLSDERDTGLPVSA